MFSVISKKFDFLLLLARSDQNKQLLLVKLIKYIVLFEYKAVFTNPKKHFSQLFSISYYVV